MSEERRKYTQAEWDREVGWGEVPPEYQYETASSDNTSEPKEVPKGDYDRAMKGI